MHRYYTECIKNSKLIWQKSSFVPPVYCLSNCDIEATVIVIGVI